MERINIAIDGPAGAGKSTIAKMVAKKLDYIYVDTGAMYRALTWKALHSNIPVTDPELVIRLAEDIAVELRLVDGSQQVWVDHEFNVTNEIREPEVTKHVSDVAKIAEVRYTMVNLQKKMSEKKGVVMDGRDIGTHVIPDAEVKIFLTASVDERANRRYTELAEKGYNVDYETLKRDIIQRDRMDSEREASPLVQAADAILVDSTGMTIDQVIELILSICRTKLGGEE
jgi:cytidylate kinase